MKSNEKNEQDITKQIEEKSISESEARKYLSIAFSNEDVNLIKLIINHYPELVNQVLIFDYYPLHEIAFIENMSNRHEAVNLLLDKGADVNIQTGIRNNTPLTMVFGRKQIETFYLLLSKGANKNITLGLSVPYIQYIVDECFDEIQLDKDNKTILQNTKKSYEFKFYNYDQLLKMFDWYHSLSEKYKDKEYKNKFHTFFEKAKKEAIEYMLILQDILLNHYFQDEANPKSMLMIKHEKLGEQQRVELTNKEINQLEDSIINFLSVQKIGMYYIPLIMTKNNEKGLALKELVLSSENYLLPREL